MDICIGNDATGDTNGNGICNDIIGKLWFSDYSNNLVYLDTQSGKVTIIGVSSIRFTDIAFDGTGQLFGIDGYSLYKIVIPSAQEADKPLSIIQVGPQGTSRLVGMIGSNSGVLYAAGNGGLWEIDPSTGVQTSIGSGSGDSYYCSGDMAFHNGILYMSSDMSHGTLINELVAINTENGDGTFIGYFYISDDYIHQKDHGFFAMGNHNGTTFAIMDNELYEVDTKTAILTHRFKLNAQGLGPVIGAAFEVEAQ